MKFTIAIVCLVLSGTACARDINFEASVDGNKVCIGERILLNLTFHNTQSVPKPELPPIEGFQSHYLGPSKMMSIVNGKITSSITHPYALVPLKAGKFTIGPLSVEYKGKTYTSNKIVIEVGEGTTGKKRQAQTPGQPQLELKDRISLLMKVGKRRLYLNEVVPLTIRLLVNNLPVRDIEYPQFAHQGFSVDEHEKPKQYKKVIGGMKYDVIEFKTRMFAARPGELAIGPAQLKCNLIIRKQRQRRPRSFFNDDIFEDFFGQHERYPLNLKSERIPITVLPLPEKEKPENFKGAVGDFSLTVRAKPTEVRIGDPITLKMTIRGQGNFNTVTCPGLNTKKGFKTYEPRARQENNVKTFEQVLMPKTDEVKEIPGITFSFFDPAKEQYVTASRGPVPIRVTRPEKEEELRIVEIPQAVTTPAGKEKLGRDIVYIKQSPGKLKKKSIFTYQDKGFLLLQILPVLFFISVQSIYKRVEKLKTDERYARLIRAPRKAGKGIREAQQFLNRDKPEEFYGVVFKTMREFLGDKFHLPPGGITSNVVDQVLKTRDISEDVLNKLKDIFRDCDTARYAPSEFERTEMETTFKKMQEVIAYLRNKKL